MVTMTMMYDSHRTSSTLHNSPRPQRWTELSGFYPQVRISSSDEMRGTAIAQVRRRSDSGRFESSHTTTTTKRRSMSMIYGTELSVAAVRFCRIQWRPSSNSNCPGVADRHETWSECDVSLCLTAMLDEVSPCGLTTT